PGSFHSGASAAGSRRSAVLPAPAGDSPAVRKTASPRPTQGAGNEIRERPARQPKRWSYRRVLRAEPGTGPATTRTVRGSSASVQSPQAMPCSSRKVVAEDEREPRLPEELGGSRPLHGGRVT